MAVNIDTVYQKVLAFANKEQRGYITPQEFNLFAEQAQLEIFEQYFYDINQFARVHGNSDEYADIKSNLQEKTSVFERTTTLGASTFNAFHSAVYRVGCLYYDNVEVEEVQHKDILYMNNSYLTKPTESRPVFTRKDNSISIYPSSIPLTSISYTYVKKPAKPSWTYVVINEKAMYDPSNINLKKQNWFIKY